MKDHLAAGTNPATELRRRYILALSLIALVSIISQTVIQCTIIRRNDDGRVVNIAGRQRMLSQKLTKSAMGIVSAAPEGRRTYLAELKETARLIQLSHHGLIHGDKAIGISGDNSSAIAEKYRRIEPYLLAMLDAVTNLVDKAERSAGAETLHAAAAPILDYEAQFLVGMDEITFMYDSEARARIDVIRAAEYALLLLTLLLLALEARFIFIPTERQIAVYFREYTETVKTLNDDIKRHISLEEGNKKIVDASRKSIERAKILQRWMITQDLPMPDGYDIAAMYIPSENLSGDMFIVREQNGRLAVILADCTGHGIAASMSANLVWRYIYRFEHMLHDDVPAPGTFLENINEKLCESPNDEFGYPTMFVAVIDTGKRKAWLANAGGVPPFYFNGQTIKSYYQPHGLLLGLKPDSRYLVTELVLEENDTLFFVSDGLLEEQFHGEGTADADSEKLLGEVLRDYPDRGYLENLNYLFMKLSNRDRIGPLFDDTTMVLVKAVPFRNGEAHAPRATIFL